MTEAGRAGRARAGVVVGGSWRGRHCQTAASDTGCDLETLEARRQSATNAAARQCLSQTGGRAWGRCDVVRAVPGSGGHSASMAPTLRGRRQSVSGTRGCARPGGLAVCGTNPSAGLAGRVCGCRRAVAHAIARALALGAGRCPVARRPPSSTRHASRECRVCRRVDMRRSAAGLASEMPTGRQPSPHPAVGSTFFPVAANGRCTAERGVASGISFREPCRCGRAGMCWRLPPPPARALPHHWRSSPGGALSCSAPSSEPQAPEAASSSIGKHRQT